MISSRVVGIDTGKRNIGVAILENQSVIHCSLLDGSDLVALHRDFSNIIQEYRPGLVGFEKPFFNACRMVSAYAIIEVIGVQKLVLGQFGIPYKEVSAKSVKKITGSGSASKEEVKDMCIRTLNIPEEFVREKAKVSKFEENHIWDAIAVALLIKD